MVFGSLSAFLGAKRSPSCYFLFLGYNGEYALKIRGYHIKCYFMNLFKSCETKIQNNCLHGAPYGAFRSFSAF